MCLNIVGPPKSAFFAWEHRVSPVGPQDLTLDPWVGQAILAATCRDNTKHGDRTLRRDLCFGTHKHLRTIQYILLHVLL